MIGKPATKECQECHFRFPITEMQKTTRSVKTGRSGTSSSFGITKSGNIRNVRIHSGRSSYRTKDVWICNDCNGTNARIAKEKKREEEKIAEAERRKAERIAKAKRREEKKIAEEKRKQKKQADLKKGCEQIADFFQKEDNKSLEEKIVILLDKRKPTLERTGFNIKSRSRRKRIIMKISAFLFSLITLFFILLVSAGFEASGEVMAVILFLGFAFFMYLSFSKIGQPDEKRLKRHLKKLNFTD